MDIVGVAWIVGIVIAAIIVVMILARAFRGMRPTAPEAQVYAPAAAMSRTTPTSASASTLSGLTPQVTAEIDRLVAGGHKIHAIKLLREHTGLSLKGAKDRIDHWSVSTTAPHLAAVSHASAATSSISPATATPSSVRASLPAGVAANIDRLIAANQKIVAIKLLREHTGFGLAQSKNLIDSWR